MLIWKKNGMMCALTGVRNTRTNELRSPTEAEKEKFKSDFQGKEYLDTPGFVEKPE